MAIGMHVLYLTEPHTGSELMATRQSQPKPPYAHYRNSMVLKYEIVKHIYSHNSDEIMAACEHFNLSHDTSTAHRSETNGIAENAVRRVKEGTSCTISQSSLCVAWWKEAMECYCVLKNVVDIFWTNKTSYCMRFIKTQGPYYSFWGRSTLFPIICKG